MGTRSIRSPAPRHYLRQVASILIGIGILLFVPISIKATGKYSGDPRELVLTYCPKCISYPLYIVGPTPTPTKRPAPPLNKKIISVSVSSSEVDVLIDKYGKEFRVDTTLLKQIARCESGFNAGAVNGPYGGMYQFLISTWQSNRRRMGLSDDPNLRFHPEEAIKTAAFKIANDGAGAWPVCGRRT